MNAVQDNIYINGEYFSKNPGWGREDSLWKAAAIDKLIKKNKLNPKGIIEIGCGFGEILVHLANLNKQVATFTGYDISPQAIAEAKKRETDHIHFSLADFAEDNEQEEDLVLIIDVLEHVPDYLNFLKKVRIKGKNFIFHIPLDISCRTIFKPHVILQQRKEAGHLHYFTREHAEWILRDAGFSIEDWFYTFSETDRNKPHSVKQWIKKQLRKFSFFLSKEKSVKLWGGYSLMVYCRAI